MSELRRARARMWAFFARQALDAELEEELAAHVELATEEYMSHGLPEKEARRLALANMGGLTQARERHREARGVMKLDIFLQDLRYTLRGLRKDAGFTVVAVLILALSIGANVAVFSVVNTLLLRPLPFPNAQELTWIAPPPAKCGMSCATYSTDAYDEFRTHTRSFQDVTGYFAFSGPDNVSMLVNGTPIPVTAVDVMANFFNVLGVNPAMGRAFTADDARNGAAPVVLLSDAWWRRQFAGDPGIVGKAIDLDGKQTTVIGVLPKTFDFGAVFSPGSKVDAITPLNLYGPPRNWGNIVTLIGRMKPGVTLAQARGDAAAAAPYMCWNNNVPQSCGSYKDQVVPVALKDYVSGRLRRSLVVLWSAVGAILLIACVNLSNLMLARAASRAREFAMRGALGASRRRIVGQLLTESLMLSLAGAVLGLGIAGTVITWLTHQGAVALPLLSTLRIDGAALGWTVLIAVFAAAFFGLMPGLRMAGTNLQEALKDGGGSGLSRKHERVRSLLVVTEVALAFVLLVGAGLLLRSFIKVVNTDLGFEPARAASINVDYDDSVPGDKDGSLSAIKRGEIFQTILARITAIPGVEAAGFSDYLPLGANRAWGTPLPKGVKRPDKLDTGPLVYVVSPGYLRAMGTRVSGRDFAWSDGPRSEHVVVVSRGYAHYMSQLAHWPSDEYAIGQVLDNSAGQPERVIGIAGDVHAETTEDGSGWQIYYPATQESPSRGQLVVRSRVPQAVMGTTVLRALQELNPRQTKAEFKPVQGLVDHANSPRRFFMLLVGTFAGLGLLLAALGIYGVISYTVTRQRQEIGIRMALGASLMRVQRDVLAGTLRLAVTGIVLGTAGALAAAKLIGSLLYGTSPWDVTSYVVMALALLLVAGVAGYLPARRASRVSPLVALRAE